MFGKKQTTIVKTCLNLVLFDGRGWIKDRDTAVYLYPRHENIFVNLLKDKIFVISYGTRKFLINVIH